MNDNIDAEDAMEKFEDLGRKLFQKKTDDDAEDVTEEEPDDE